VTIAFDISHNGFLIRRAEQSEAQAVRMLIPELRDTAAAFVALDGMHKLVVGAAVMTRSARRQPLVGPGIAVHVIVPCRSHGIAKSLVGHLAAAAQAAGYQALFSARRVVDGSAESGAWQRLGFTPCETVQEHVLPLEQFEPRIAPLVDHLRQRGRIPTSARIIPLYQANHAAVLQLHLDHLGGDRDDLNRKLQGSCAGSFHPRYSRVLLVGDRVVGCILAHRADKDTAVVDADIVDSSLRGGWANVWLKLVATRGALRLGIKQFQFTTFDQYTDTRSFAMKLGGYAIRTTLLMMRPIAEAHGKTFNSGAAGHE
jgi:N-acetylglutamate synthase-like GNAT family acetyltransferase